jgi:uncharacterized protein (TIGR03067 family)
MWRILTAGLIGIAGIALARVAIAAPGPKDPPKKDSPIVGEWQLLSVDGQETISATYNFSATGDLDARGFIGNVESGFRARYVTNEKPDPFEIDITHRDERYEGIVKFEGDRLTICYRLGRGKRPKKFDEKGATQEVFERVRKKD